jgi:hypothetical protein
MGAGLVVELVAIRTLAVVVVVAPAGLLKDIGRLASYQTPSPG